MADTAPVGAFFHDSFDGTGDLNAHSPDIGMAGADWFFQSGLSQVPILLSGGTATPNGVPGDRGIYYYKRPDDAITHADGSDYEVRMRFSLPGAGVNASFRIHVGAFSDFNRAILVVALDGITVQADAGTVAHPFTTPLTAGVTYELVYTKTAASITTHVVGEADTF